MKIKSAEYDVMDGLTVTIDGHSFWVGMKYTIIEEGWVVLVGRNPEGDAWVEKHGQSSPNGNVQGRMFFQDVVLVALAALAWHRKLTQGPVEIPSIDQARAVLAEYKIQVP